MEQLTADPTSNAGGFMFQAPDFADNTIFFTLAKQAAGTTIQVYAQIGFNPNGSPIFTLVNSIASPDPNEPYMNSAEPFINCTPVCTTYVYITLSKTSDSQNGSTQPNGLAVVALNPATPMFNIQCVGSSAEDGLMPGLLNDGTMKVPTRGFPNTPLTSIRVETPGFFRHNQADYVNIHLSVIEVRLRSRTHASPSIISKSEHKFQIQKDQREQR